MMIFEQVMSTVQPGTGPNPPRFSDSSICLAADFFVRPSIFVMRNALSQSGSKRASSLACYPLFQAAAQILKNLLLPLLYFEEHRFGE